MAERMLLKDYLKHSSKAIGFHTGSNKRRRAQRFKRKEVAHARANGHYDSRQLEIRS